MKLGKTFPPGGRPPLRTMTEIADALGIPSQQLMWALKRADAPPPVFRGKEAGHSNNPHVWYDPREVVRWYRTTVLPDDPAAKRRQYHRDYIKQRKANELTTKQHGSQDHQDQRDHPGPTDQAAA